ncbi:hypothetical protein GQ457_04G034430 [Hibiscus cannabinus]
MNERRRSLRFTEREKSRERRRRGKNNEAFSSLFSLFSEAVAVAVAVAVALLLVEAEIQSVRKKENGILAGHPVLRGYWSQRRFLKDLVNWFNNAAYED